MSTARVIGTVTALYRYPVKSMAGETPDAVWLAEHGIVGDRAYALVDAETGRVASGKRPKHWGDVMHAQAAYQAPVSSEGPLPVANITLPDGTIVETSDVAEANAVLSDRLGRAVRLEGQAPQGAAFEYHWPDMEGLVYKGRTYRDEITVNEMPPGTFFDSCAVNLMTTASLARMSELLPDSTIDVARYRPNILVETEESGFVENGWIGGEVRIGDAQIAVTGPCLRCVMVTLPQGDLPKDTAILRGAFDHNDGNLGVKGDVRAPGAIQVGDPVYLLD